MPTALKNLEVNEISGVDRGANPGAKAVLVKRKFSDDERKALAASGAALPDGSFPIKDSKDVKDAVDDFGRSGSKPEVKAHIVARAKALGCTDALPAGWISKRSLGHVFTDATGALRKSLHSIFAGNTALPLGDTSLDQFAAAMGAAIAKADDAAASNGDIAKQENTDMTTITLEKALEEIAALKAAATKTAEDDEKKREDDEKMKKSLADLAKENAILKMSDKHKDFHSKLSGDAKDKFGAMAPDERDDYISKNPVEKALPAEVQKALVEGEALRKRVAELEKGDQLVKFGKRATDIGLGESHAETLMKAHAGDAEAVTKLEDFIKALTAQVKEAGLFKEFGNKGTDANDPVAKMDVAIAEVQKADPKLSREGAVLKIAESREYAPIWKAFKEAGQTAA